MRKIVKAMAWTAALSLGVLSCAGQGLLGLYLALLTLDWADDALAETQFIEVRAGADDRWVPVQQAGEAPVEEGLGIDGEDQDEGDEEVRARQLFLRRRSDGSRLFVGFHLSGPRQVLEFQLLHTAAEMASRAELVWEQPGWAFQAARPADGGWEAMCVVLADNGLWFFYGEGPDLEGAVSDALARWGAWEAAGKARPRSDF
jgi:hypothetical protein